MKTDIWMPFYIGDYLKDTMKLSPEKHGIYLLLIINYWQEGPLSNDLEELAVVARVSPDSIALKYILDNYFTLSDGRYHQKRIDEEMKNASENKERRTERAKKAADARWNATSNATSIQQAMHNECPSSSPSPSPTESEKRKEHDYRFKIIAHWNSKEGFPNHSQDVALRHLTKSVMGDTIPFTATDINESIDTYHEVVTSDKYYFNHRWTLWEFLKRGFSKFCYADIARENFLVKNTQSTHSQPPKADYDGYASPRPKYGTCRHCKAEDVSLSGGLCPDCRVEGVK